MRTKQCLSLVIACGIAIVFLPPTFAQKLTDYSNGMNMYRLRKYAEAALYFERATRDEKEAATAYYYLANCYAAMHRKADAIAAYQKSYRLNARSQVAPYCLTAIKQLTARPTAPDSSPVAAGTAGSDSSAVGSNNNAAAAPVDRSNPRLATNAAPAQTKVAIDMLLEKGFKMEQAAKFNDAEHLYRQGLYEAERLGRQSQYLVNALDSLAGFYTARKETHKAEPLYKRELAAVQALPGDKRADVLRIKRSLAICYLTEKSFHDAQPLLEDCMNARKQIYEQALNQHVSKQMQPRGDLAQAYEDMSGLMGAIGRVDDAVQYASLAQQLRQQTENEYTK